MLTSVKRINVLACCHRSVEASMVKSPICLFDEERQRCGVTVEKILLADRTNLAITEKPCQADGSKAFLHVPGVVTGFAKEVLPPTIATAQACAVNFSSRQLLLRPLEHHRHIFRAAGRIPPLKLNGLARARKSPHGNRAALGIGAD
jgi:hypothetical protein